MSASKPKYMIDRLSLGDVAEYAKMFDPPKATLPGDNPLPEHLNLSSLVVTPTGPVQPNPPVRPNPVPEVCLAAGFFKRVVTPHTLKMSLLNGKTTPTWDGKKQLFWMCFGSSLLADGFTGAQYPGMTIRVPRGAVFHCTTHAKGPPPHTIHWHGIEPTPVNDGVGHCSMEIGDTVYQWQPNFIGTYFYHCHRNTMQHFNFGLYGLLIIEPPDAYFSSLNTDGTLNRAIPIGACSDGKFRTAANMTEFAAPRPDGLEFPGYVGGDPVNGVADGNPWSYTVPYDEEALWVLADRDSVWSDLASNARATFPRQGVNPGVDDEFHRNPTQNNFFNFNDYRADYWFVTGSPVLASAAIPGFPNSGIGRVHPALPPPRGMGLRRSAYKAGFAGVPVLPPELNSGKRRTQVVVRAYVGETVLIRVLNGAYNWARIKLPVDAVIIAWDGRALGVPPFGRYNKAYKVTKGEWIWVSTARRCDILIKPTAPINDFAVVDFIETRNGGFIGADGKIDDNLATQHKTVTGLISIKAIDRPPA